MIFERLKKPNYVGIEELLGCDNGICIGDENLGRLLLRIPESAKLVLVSCKNDLDKLEEHFLLSRDPYRLLNSIKSRGLKITHHPYSQEDIDGLVEKGLLVVNGTIFSQGDHYSKSRIVGIQCPLLKTWNLNKRYLPADYLRREAA